MKRKSPVFAVVCSIHFQIQLAVAVTIAMILFALKGGFEQGAWASLFYVFQVIGHFFPLVLLLYLPLLLPKKFARTRQILVIGTTSAMTVALVCDFVFYLVFNMHINGAFFWVLSSVEGLRATGLGITECVLAVAILGAVVSGQVFLGLRFWKIHSHVPAGFLFATLSLIMISEKCLYAYFDLIDLRSATRSAVFIPLYQRVTVQRLSTKFNFPVKRITKYDDTAVPVGHYRNTDLPNIVLVVIDSWRFDSLSQENMPNLWRWAQKNTVQFHSHYSGGNNTRDGVFSIFYGAHSHLWNETLAGRIPPKLLVTLKALKYRVSAYSSASLDFPEFRKTVFYGQNAQYIYDELEGDEAYIRDKAAIARFKKDTQESDPSVPRFDFLFLDGPHNPYSHSDAAKRFLPSNQHFFIAAIGDQEDILKIHNKYRNSVYQTDMTIKKVLQLAAPGKALADSIIVVTGDHGEEFYDFGYWGHFSSFNPAQTKVPFLLKLPGVKPRIVKHRTSHVDLAQTLLTQLKRSSPFPPEGSQKGPLFEKVPNRTVISCGWDKCAMMSPSYCAMFGVNTYNAYIFNTYGPNCIHEKSLSNPEVMIPKIFGMK